MPSPACSVVIRCYNEERHIGRLLEGIAQQTLRPLDIVLVDSGSTDRTLEIARRFSPTIVSIRPDEFSFGRALNFGCERARGEVVVAASAHVYPLYSDWLRRLVSPLSDPSVALSYGRQVGDQRTRFSEHRLFEHWFPARSVAKQRSPFCNNANAALRRADWRAHPYDEELTGLEDIAWAKAAAERGQHVSYVAEAVVAHVHEETWGRVFNRYRREAVALGRIAPDEVLRWSELAWLLPGHILSDCWAAARAGRLRRESWDIAAFRSAQFLGTYRGSRDSEKAVARLKHRFYYPMAPSQQSVPASRQEVTLPSQEVDYTKVPSLETATTPGQRTAPSAPCAVRAA